MKHKEISNDPAMSVFRETDERLQNNGVTVEMWIGLATVIQSEVTEVCFYAFLAGASRTTFRTKLVFPQCWRLCLIPDVDKVFPLWLVGVPVIHCSLWLWQSFYLLLPGGHSPCLGYFCRMDVLIRTPVMTRGKMSPGFLLFSLWTWLFSHPLLC